MFSLKKNNSIYSSDCRSSRLIFLKSICIFCALVLLIVGYVLPVASADEYPSTGESNENQDSGRTYIFIVDTSASWFEKRGTSFTSTPWRLSVPIRITFDSASRSASVALTSWSTSAVGILVGGTYTLGSYMNTLGSLGFSSAFTDGTTLSNSAANFICGGYIENLTDALLIDTARASFFSMGSENYGIDVELLSENIPVSRIHLQFSGLFGIGGAFPSVSFFNGSTSEIEALIEERVRTETSAYKSYIDAQYNAKIEASKDAWYGDGYRDAEAALGTPYTFKKLFNAVFETPLRFVYSLLNFDFLGINVFSFATSIITVIIVFAIIKIIGGIIL